MPRKTKELEEVPIEITKKVTSTTKNFTNNVSNKVVAKKSATTKKVEKKDNISKSSNSKPSGTTSKNKTTKTGKASVKEAKTNKVTKKTFSTKASTKTITNTKINSKKDNSTNTVSIVEYYDLPLRYNQTIVKILAQTPNMLFIYWDIADSDKKLFEEHYGADFFRETKPVLIIHNETMNYSFEVEINDFANSWYLHVNDSDCKYEIELGRRPLIHISTIKENYIYISSSNKMNLPNNHILFEKFDPSVKYKNLKNGNVIKKDFTSLSNYKNMQEIYNIYDLYKTIYKDTLFGEIADGNLTNPSSMSSSIFK